MVKEIKDKSVMLQMPDKSIVEVPCGMVVWAAVSLCFGFPFFFFDYLMVPTMVTLGECG
jgi:hypothetical protein